MNSAWKEFATQNNLRFQSENWLLLRDEKVWGHYEDYQFTLELIYRRKSVTLGGRSSDPQQIFTRMALSMKKRMANLQKDHFGADDQLDEEGLISFLIPTASQQTLIGRIYASRGGLEIVHEQEGITFDVEYLQFLLRILKNLIEAYPIVVELGGEIAPVLQSIVDKKFILRPIAGQLLFDIGQDTEKRLKRRLSQWWCPDCLVHCGEHQTQVHWLDSFYYYGCRACHQSRRLVELADQRVIAVLDSTLSVEEFQLDSMIRVNWLIRRRLFDFDEVEILQATDEDVEHFAVQVGNDNDPVRQPLYKQMRCVVSPVCRLSENTLRILRWIFGKVKVTET